MTLVPTAMPTPEAEPDQVEVLLTEARRRGRRHRIALGSLIVALVAGATAGAVIGSGGRGGPPGTTHERHPVRPVVTAAEWATARRTCEGKPLQAARSDAPRPHLYGAYPTTVRLAVNWPTKVYPLAGPPPSTTTPPAGEPAPRVDPWDGYNTSRPATICIFTGRFRLKVPSMQGIYVQHARVLVMQLLDMPPMPSAISIYPMSAVPRRPVPVA